MMMVTNNSYVHLEKHAISHFHPDWVPKIKFVGWDSVYSFLYKLLEMQLTFRPSYTNLFCPNEWFSS